MARLQTLAFSCAIVLAPLAIASAMPPRGAEPQLDPLPAASGLTADYLDDHDSTFFHPAAAKAVDADRLDGLDSAQLLRSDRSGTVDGDVTVRGALTADGPLGFSGQKVCAAYRRTYYDTDYTFILVPATWSAATCRGWAGDVGSPTITVSSALASAAPSPMATP